MKLLYLYLANYPPFPKNAEFNFDSNWRFEFDHAAGVVTCEETDALPQDFYEKESNVDCVSAIIGQNGAGKTSIAKVLTELFSRTKNNCPEHILVYQLQSGKLQMSYFLKDDGKAFRKELAPKQNGKGKFPSHEVVFHQWSSNECDEKNLWDDFRFVYLSPFFTTERVILPHKLNNIIDLSTTGLLSNERGGDRKNILKTHAEREIKRAVEFFSDKRYNCIENIRLPHGMKISFDENLFDLYANELSLHCLRSNDFSKSMNDMLDKICSKNLSGVDLDGKIMLCYIAMVLSAMTSIPPDIGANAELTNDTYLAYTRKLDAKAADFFQWFSQQRKDFKHSNDSSEAKQTDVALEISGNSDMFDFVDKYYACLQGDSDFLHYEFDPRLSSGEMAYITMFARLYECLKKADEKPKDYLVFLDEVEICLHPEWQRCLVKNFLTFFQQYFPKKHFHLIFASHSPILLSDIPKDNVCFLQREEGKNTRKLTVKKTKLEELHNTFGANIFELYKESFFLKNGLMGQFAMKKINDLLGRAAKWQELNGKGGRSNGDDQQQENEDFENDEKLLQLIGERMIRNYLAKVFEEMKHNV